MTPDAPRAILTRYGREHQPIGELRSLGGSGGLSGSRLWRFKAESGERVLRAWPEGEQGRPRVETIHGWLREARDLDFVPQPIPALDGRTVMEHEGRCWELAPWMPGAAEVLRPPRVDRVRAAFRALGAFHVRLPRGEATAPSPGLRRCCSELERLTAGGFGAIEAGLRESRDDPLLPPAREWLDLARSTTPAALGIVRDATRLTAPLQPCLRDARPEHFLFAGDQVVGLVDYGAMDLESVAADLARLIGEWLPIPGAESLRAEAIKTYTQVHTLTESQLAQATGFEAAADVLIGERWVRWRFLESRRFDRPSAYTEGLNRGLGRLKGLAARLG